MYAQPTTEWKWNLINNLFNDTRMGNIAILDIETGGFSTTKNGVCEIALLVVSKDLTEEIATYTVLIKPYTRADDTDELVSYKEDAMAVHGITIEELETNGVPVAIALIDMFNVLECENVSTILGHNVKAFDIPKVEHLTDRFLGKNLNDYSKVCTLQLSKQHLTSTSNKLGDLCAEFGIEQVNSHRALSDCYSTLGLARVLNEKGFFIID